MNEQTSIAGVTVVAVDGHAIMLSGPPGSGKSTLALALIDRGAVLIGDDGISLLRESTRLLATPPPNIAGKIEVRNVGIVEIATTSAPLALVLRLTPDAPRFPETVSHEVLLDVAIPALAFDPALAAAPLRAEWALRTHGAFV